MAITASIIAGTVALAAAGTAAYASTQNANATNKTNSTIAQQAQQQASEGGKNQALLTAEAMKRASASTTDGRGSTIRFDPATNTWVTSLGDKAQGLQSSSDNAIIQRNTGDREQQQASTQENIRQNLLARRGYETALGEVKNFTPRSVADVEGGYNQVASDANRLSTQPIIADTLRAFARTGTNAAPVLTSLQRDNANSLRNQLLQNHIQAMMDTPKINSANKSSLIGDATQLGALSKQNPAFTGVQVADPDHDLNAISAQRAGGAAAPATAGAYNVGASIANQGLAANRLIAANKPSEDGNTLLGLSKQLPGLADKAGDLYNSIFGTKTPTSTSSDYLNMPTIDQQNVSRQVPLDNKDSY